MRICRFHEITLVYGQTIKELIHEQSLHA